MFIPFKIIVISIKLFAFLFVRYYNKEVKTIFIFMTNSNYIQLELPLFAKYKVTHFIDCGAWIDPDPTIEYFEEWYEMEDYVNEETQRRIDYTVQHSPFTISEEEYKEIEEHENSMYKIEEITNNGLKLIKGWVNSFTA